MFCKLDVDLVEIRKHSILIYDNGLYNNWPLCESVLERRFVLLDFAQ